MKGLVGGLLALTLLQAVLSTEGAADRVGGAATLAADVFRRLIDPNVALIPDRRGGGSW